MPTIHASLVPQVPLQDGASASPQASGPGLMVVVVDEVVVVHGHAGCAMLPTATFKHRRASVDVTGGAPLSSQMHSGSQAPIPTATFNMNRQSLATEPVPVLTGWPQSPWPASAAAGLPIESARTRNIAEMAVMGRACHNSKAYFYPGERSNRVLRSWSAGLNALPESCWKGTKERHP